MNLLEIQHDLRRITQREASKAVEEEREVTDTILGVDVVLKYAGTSGRGTTRVFSGVFLNGERYGMETDVHPWSIFKPSFTFYEVGGLMSRQQAENIARGQGR